jgi:hypothetical protein
LPLEAVRIMRERPLKTHHWMIYSRARARYSAGGMPHEWRP